MEPRRHRTRRARHQPKDQAPGETTLWLRISRRELATILAALRFHQDENLQGEGAIPDKLVNQIASNGGILIPLGFDEVSSLCERLAQIGQVGKIAVELKTHVPCTDGELILSRLLEVDAVPAIASQVLVDDVLWTVRSAYLRHDNNGSHWIVEADPPPDLACIGDMDTCAAAWAQDGWTIDNKLEPP